MRPYRDPDQPPLPGDVDPASFELSQRAQLRSGGMPYIPSSSFGCWITVFALVVVVLLILWGLQSLGIYQP